MNIKKSADRKGSENELELGKYLESDMIALAEDDVSGGTLSVVLTAVTGYVSYQTCPTTSCTKAC